MDIIGNWAFMPVVGCEALSFSGFGLVQLAAHAPAPCMTDIKLATGPSCQYVGAMPFFCPFLLSYFAHPPSRGNFLTI